MRAAYISSTNDKHFGQAVAAGKAVGIIPLAHGGQAWQEAYMFEAVALGIGGADFYRKALVDRNRPVVTAGVGP